MRGTSQNTHADFIQANRGSQKGRRYGPLSAVKGSMTDPQLFTQELTLNPKPYWIYVLGLWVLESLSSVSFAIPEVQPHQETV